MQPFRPPAGIALLLLLASSCVLADSKVYKYRMPDGSLLYTQNRAPAGKLESVIQVASPTPAQVARAQREVAADRALADRLEADRNRGRMVAAENRLRQAADALANAEIALRAGAEPLPGERVGNVNGTSRLNEAYWDRMVALRRSVDEARLRLDVAAADVEAGRLASAPVVGSSGQ